MQVKDLAPEQYRFERKFAVDLSPAELEMHIKLHPYFFKEIYHERWINNIYFDSQDYKNYNENVLGVSRRLKVRIRWYDDLFGNIEKPVLEFKIKSGMLGRKESYKLPPYFLPEHFETRQLHGFFNADLPEEVVAELKELQPALMNRYKRKYFLSSNKSFRITLDTDMQFFALKNFSNQITKKVENEDYNVIELKYTYENEKEADRVSSVFPFRVTKSSKYVDGMDRLKEVF